MSIIKFKVENEVLVNCKLTSLPSILISQRTNYHLGTLKAKLAKLRSELVNGPGGKSAGSKDAGRGFDVTKSGDTRIGLVGFPSVGKSTLLTTLTGTRSEAAAYEFTTLTCIPGTMKCECHVLYLYRLCFVINQVCSRVDALLCIIIMFVAIIIY